MVAVTKLFIKLFIKNIKKHMHYYLLASVFTV